MDLTKKHAGTRCAELVFLHLVGSASPVVHFGVFRVQNVDTLFFMLRWYRYRFDKRRVGSCYAEHVSLDLLGSVGHVVHSGESGSMKL
jgi:hypothetical protein